MVIIINNSFVIIIFFFFLDIVLWDPSATAKLSLSTAHMMTDQFPFDGFQMKGAPSMVFVRGQCIKHEVGGECLNVAPRGRFVQRY
jgi:dihydropyrimidinase